MTYSFRMWEARRRHDPRQQMIPFDQPGEPVQPYHWNGQGNERVRIVKGENAGRTATVIRQLPQHAGIGTPRSRLGPPTYLLQLDGIKGGAGEVYATPDQLEKL